MIRTEQELLAMLPIEIWTECDDGQALLRLARQGKCKHIRVNSTCGRFETAAKINKLPNAEVENYVRDALALFVNDPPDSPHQEGYLQALINVAVEGLGIPGHDPDVLRASNCTPNGIPADPKLTKRKLFTVIDGDKDSPPSHPRCP